MWTGLFELKEKQRREIFMRKIGGKGKIAELQGQEDAHSDSREAAVSAVTSNLLPEGIRPHDRCRDARTEGLQSHTKFACPGLADHLQGT